MPERTQTLHTQPTLHDLIDTVGCPTCRVGTGAPCVTRANKPAREPHGSRFQALEQAAGITEHRAAASREAEARGRCWATTDREAEQALLSAYAARIAQTPDRTHLTQPDEALRQVRLDATVRDGLRLIADRLAHIHPEQLMTPAQRQAIALTIADTTHPANTDAAVELERHLLRRMPFVDGRVVTRGEYALWLRKTSWGA